MATEHFKSASSSRGQAAKMVWTNEHNILLVREILVARPFQFKHGSRERGHAWDKVADALNTVEQPRFSVDQRGVRERFSKLEKAFKKRMREEEKASGINPEMPELDEAIETIVSMEESAERENLRGEGEKRRAIEKDKHTAESARKRSMERLAETRERESQASAQKRSRRSINTVEYLKEKGKREEEQRQQEYVLKEKELALKEKKQENAFTIQRNEQILREKEVALLTKQQHEMEKKDSELREVMQRILAQQEIIHKELHEQKQLILSLTKKN